MSHEQDPGESGPQGDETPSVLAATGGKAIAAVVGATVAGPVGAVVAVAVEPFFVELAQRSWSELGAARQQAAGLMLSEASAHLGGEPDDLTATAMGDPTSAQLLADALQAAATTSNEAKIRALGRALANGLAEDGARVDEEQLVIAGLAVLEAAHIRVLVNLPTQRARPTGTPTRTDAGPAGRRGLRLATVAEASGLSQEGATNVLSELTRSGMAARDTYGASRRSDRLIVELQEQVAALGWRLDNPTKKPPQSKKTKKLDKPGTAVEAGYERTPFGDVCLTYLGELPESDQVEPDAEATDEETLTEIDEDPDGDEAGWE